MRASKLITISTVLVFAVALATCAATLLGAINLPFLNNGTTSVNANLLPQDSDRAPSYVASHLTWNDLPEYDGEITWIVLNGGEPTFSNDELTTSSFERYSPLDKLGRAGVAVACLGPETLPADERGDISEVHPSGWQTDRYSFIEGELLFNRSHLIAFSLSGENANAWNLVTGTRYLNAELMLPYEQETLYYIRSSHNHVMYRVSPVFSGDELVCRGVHMEGYSVEDSGNGICFNVFLYNVQPGVEIDYATGANHLVEAAARPDEQPQPYVLNIRSRKVHLPECPNVKDISAANRSDVTERYSQLELEGYEPCSVCQPNKHT